ncbi:MAG TPA: hypothetical protein VH619_15590 [Verrucomicrobiae bacterium]|nr:hypothetical protein [Verrucomicrobiae bacterium]
MSIQPTPAPNTGTIKPFISSDITMKAFIVYSDLASVANASATLRRVGTNDVVRAMPMRTDSA